MENLETQERVISLGKKLLASLKKDEADEITSWMINYLAEKIDLAESGSEEAKNSCIDVILKLWERRATLPNGTRPFENFEPIFKALYSLSPEAVNPRYFSNFSDEQGNETEGELASLIELGKNLDVAARTLISFIFEKAVETATDKDTVAWLQSISKTVSSSEYEFIIRHTEVSSPSAAEQRVNKLKSRITQLKTFEHISKSIRQGFKEELKVLKKKGDSQSL